MLKNFFLALILMIVSLSAFAVDPATPTAPVELNFMFYFGIAMACLLAISEALGSIPSIKENGIFQVISSILNAMVVKKQKANTVEVRKTDVRIDDL